MPRRQGILRDFLPAYAGARPKIPWRGRPGDYPHGEGGPGWARGVPPLGGTDRELPGEIGMCKKVLCPEARVFKTRVPEGRHRGTICPLSTRPNNRPACAPGGSAETPCPQWRLW